MEQRLDGQVFECRGVLRIFLQAVPEGMNMPQLEAKLQQIAHVQSTHHTHIWSLDGEHNVLTTHLVVGDDATKATIVAAKAQARAIAAELEVEHITIEVEYADEDCAMRLPE